jgi:hypothetical protein
MPARAPSMPQTDVMPDPASRLPPVATCPIDPAVRVFGGSIGAPPMRQQGPAERQGVKGGGESMLRRVVAAWKG